MTLLLEWSRTRYTWNYLTWRQNEAGVQKAVLEDLRRRGAVVVAVDAGAAMFRGRTMGALKAADRMDLLPAVMAGRTGAGMKGLSDIVGVLPGGRAVFIEVKAPEWCEESPHRPGFLRSLRAAGKATDEQCAFLKAAHTLGAAAGVAWHWKDLDAILATTISAPGGTGK